MATIADKSTVGQHTPGPWSYDLLFINAPLTPRLATVGNKADGVNVTLAEAKANCRLIAAAPELLAACEAVADNWDTPANSKGGCVYCGGQPCDCFLGLVRSALAKARGEAVTT